MKVLEFIFGPNFKHFFAIFVVLLCFAMLAKGNLTETGKTRMEDTITVVVGYYFLASMSGSKKDDTIEKMVDNQKQLVESAIPTGPSDENVIRSGDPVTVVKE